MKNVYLICQTITNSAGTERALCNLANILASEKDFKVHILSIDTSSGNPFYNINKKIEVKHLGLPVGACNLLKKIKSYIDFYRILKNLLKENPSSIFIGTYTTFNCIIALLGKASLKIGCEHLNYDAMSKSRKIARKFLYKFLDYIVVLTEADKKHYNFLSNVKVIPNSLSFPRVQKADYSQKNILAIGRLLYQKGFDMLIQTAAILKGSASDWHITIIGEGTDYESLCNQIKENQLQNYVEIKPYQKDVISLYQSASIYVMSSRFEGLPMVLIEAQSCGLPCVSFNCPEGPADIIHNGIDGYLVPMNDINALADKLLRLMKDDHLRKKMGNKAFENSIQFSTEKIKQKWLEILS